MKKTTHYHFVVFLFLLPLLVLGGCVFDRYHPYFSNAPLRQNNPAISVQKGDNLYQVSKRYDVTLRDLIDINKLKPPYHIRPGQALLLPKKRLHIVRRHETLTSISRKRNVDIHSLVKMNNLKPPYNLHENQRLKLSYPTTSRSSAPFAQTKPLIKRQSKKEVEPLLPLEKKLARQKPKPLGVGLLEGGPPQKPTLKSVRKTSQKTLKKPTPSSQSRSAHKIKPIKQSPISKFQWPMRGKILAKYGKKSAGLRNDGINIKAAKGTPIKAAESGQVVYVGSALKGYGNLILIKHRGGWMTAYAHAQKTFVSKGSDIKKGQKIALVGSTGNVKIPQLHFEIRKKTRTVDPVRYLK